MSNRHDGTVTVLLVEDESDDVRLIREAFDGVDIEVAVDVATDGDEALTYLTDRGDDSPRIPDLVLLDLDLPRMDGLELLETLAEGPTLARVPVLVLTEAATINDVHESYELAANAYLTKPSNPAEYDEMVEAVADFWFRRAALPPKDS